MNPSSLKVKSLEWQGGELPREKMNRYGRHALHDAELLAILLSTGTPKLNVLDLASLLLESCGGEMDRLAKLELNELRKFPGIGEAKAQILSAAFELGGRRQKSGKTEKEKYRTSRQIYELMRYRLQDLNHEEFWMVALNKANHLLGTTRVSEGGTDLSIADPRKIYRLALELKASRLVFCHNHPSGNSEPSPADLRITERLKEAGHILDIEVLDHLIILPYGYRSFADEGWI